jgi:hypothetical protein
MTSRDFWTRRRASAALAASFVAPVPVRAQAAGPDLPQPTPPSDAGAYLETAFDRALRMSVSVHLNGKGPFAFVIDTGANRSVVCEEVAAYCRLPAAGSAPVHGIIGSEPAGLVKVDRMRVGQVISSGLRLPVVARSRVGADGLLGVDVLRGRRIVLGFRDQSFQIEPSGTGAEIGRGGGSRLSEPNGPVTVPARFRSGQLVIVDAEAAGRGVTAFLDSGSQVTVANRALRDLAMAARPELESRIIHSGLVSATGQRAAAEFAPLPGLRLGGQGLGGPLVAYSDLHIFELWKLQQTPTVLIGVDILRRFDRVAIDFGRKNVTFWPARRTAIRPS